MAQGQRRAGNVRGADPAGRRPPPVGKRTAPPGLRLGFESLLSAMDEAGNPPPPEWDYTGKHPPEVIDIETWRAEFYARHTGDTHATKKKAFQRCRADLVEGAAVGCWADQYWPIADTAGTCPWSDLVAMATARTITRSANRAAA